MSTLPPIPILIKTSVNEYKQRFSEFWALVAVYFVLAHLHLFTTFLPLKTLARSGPVEVLLGIFEFLVTSYLTILVIKKLNPATKTTPKKILQYFLLMTILFMTMFGGLMLFLIPGIIVFVMLSMSHFILVIENTTIKQSIQRGRNLVKGATFPVFVRLMVGFIPLLLIMALPDLFPIFRANVILKFIPPLLYSLMFPLEIIYSYKIYESLRSGKDNLNEKLSGGFKGLVFATGILGAVLYVLAAFLVIFHIT